MELDMGQWIVIGLCGVLLAVYIRGYFYNRSLAERAAKWLLEGLRDWGQVSSGEKLPNMATGGRMEIQQAAAPFRKLEVVYLLAPRENPLFWIFYRLQGKRDELLVWINYISKPEQVIEVARDGDRQFAARLADAEKIKLTQVPAPGALLMAVEEKDGAVLAESVGDILEAHHAMILRLALRPNKPHLFLRVNLQAACRQPAAAFFRALSTLKKTRTGAEVT